MVEKRAIKFFAIGGLTNVSGLAVASLLYQIGVTPVVASSLAYVYSLIFSFLLQSLITFRTGQKILNYKVAARFLSAHSFVFAINAFLIFVFTGFLNFSFFISTVLSTVICGLILFLASKLWVFRTVS